MTPDQGFYDKAPLREKEISLWKNALLPFDETNDIAPNFQYLALLKGQKKQLFCFVVPSGIVMGAGSICVPGTHDFDKDHKLYKLHQKVCRKNWKTMNYKHPEWVESNNLRGLDVIGMSSVGKEGPFTIDDLDGGFYDQYTPSLMYLIERNRKLIEGDYRIFRSTSSNINQSIISAMGLVAFFEQENPGIIVSPLDAQKYL